MIPNPQPRMILRLQSYRRHLQLSTLAHLVPRVTVPRPPRRSNQRSVRLAVQTVVPAPPRSGGGTMWVTTSVMHVVRFCLVSCLMSWGRGSLLSSLFPKRWLFFVRGTTCCMLIPIWDVCMPFASSTGVFDIILSLPSYLISHVSGNFLSFHIYVGLTAALVCFLIFPFTSPSQSCMFG